MSRLVRYAFILLAGCSMPAWAQLTAPTKNGDMTIVVTGTKPKASSGKKIEMSDWRMAETPHVVVFAKGDENQKELIRTAHNLEKLHFLLSVLLNRVDRRDDTVKLAVTMIGDRIDFDKLRLSNSRWQFGPYPDAFPTQIYYDPREEGPILATTQDPLKVVMDRGIGKSAAFLPPEMAAQLQQLEVWEEDPATSSRDPKYGRCTGHGKAPNEVSAILPPENSLYSLFAQNYLMTYFPAAYPRWYLQGFGEVFATIDAGAAEITYGWRPECIRQAKEFFGNYPVNDVLSGRYLNDQRIRPNWTPYQAWQLVHLLFFSDEWKQPLHNYLTAIARGADPKAAMTAFGDLRRLQKAVSGYQGRKVPFEKMTFPPERAPAPVVRHLTRAEAGLIRGRLELGARIGMPAPPVPGTDPRTAEKIKDARRAALARREAWLGRLRADASRYPELVENHLLLAEAECRSRNSQRCLQAAERALAIAPEDNTALVWRGTALAQLAANAPADQRPTIMNQARAVIARANRGDPEALLPLIAYHRSFTEAGQTPEDLAVDAMFKVVESVPAAPTPRVQLAADLIRRDLDEEARRVVLPVAKGAFETPEQDEAKHLLKNTEAGSGG